MTNKQQVRYNQATMKYAENLAGINSNNIQESKKYCRNITPKIIPLFSHYSWKPSKNSDLKNGAELLIQCLEHQGVQSIFGQFGDNTSLIGQAIWKSSIQFIPSRSGQDAAFMAQSYSRLTNKPGICLATSMQNIFNLLPSVVSANLRHIPLIVITEEAIADIPLLGSHNAPTASALFSPAIQWSQQISSPETISELITQSLREAHTKQETGLSGAVHLDLPKAVAEMLTSALPCGHSIPKKIKPNIQVLEQVAILIEKAQKPLILAGNAAVQEHIGSTLLEFATQLQIPVITSVGAKGLVPETHPLFRGIISLPEDYNCYGLDKADLLITIGCNFRECLPQFWDQSGNTTIIHIGSSGMPISHHYQSKVNLVGALSDLLPAILRQRCQTGVSQSNALDSYTITQGEQQQLSYDTCIPFKHRTLTQALQTMLTAEDILLSDQGIHQASIVRNYKSQQPNTCLSFQGSDSTELALSGAIMAKLVHPERKVIAVVGADGFMRSYSTLEPARWLKTSFVTLICNQGDCCPNFVEIAKSMGFKGYQITSADALMPTLKTALAQNTAVIIDCPVDCREHSISI